MNVSNLYAFEMIEIPEITFTRTDKAGNHQEVTVSPFYMSKYDVTVDEWFDYLDSSLKIESKWKCHYTKEEFIPSMKYQLSEGGLINRDTIAINNEWPIFGITCNRALYYCNYLTNRELYDKNLEIMKKN